MSYSKEIAGVFALDFVVVKCEIYFQIYVSS